MADYYPLIAKAVVGQSSGEARRVLYDRARTALVAQLRGVEPPLAEADITRERLSLEEAIRKVESEAARRSRADQPARPPPSRPDAPPPAAGNGPGLVPGEPPLPSGVPMPPEVPTPPERSRWGAPGGPSDRGPKRDPLGGAPLPPRGAPAGPGPTMVEPPPVADFGAGELRPPGRESPRPSGRRSEPPPPFFDAPGGGPESVQGLDEPLAPPPSAKRQDERPRGAPPRGPDGRRDGRPDKGAIKPPEPRAEARDGRRADRRAERPQERPGRSALPLGRIAIAAAAVLILLAAVAVGLWNRSAIVGYFAGTPTASRTVDTGARPKIADRIGGSPTVDDGAPVAQKVVLYEEDPNDAAGKRYVGTAVWRLESIPPAAGKPPDLAIRADIQIPDQNISARWSLRRNDDKTLPASHTVEVMFTLPPDFPHKGITNIPGVLMKQSESTRGVPLAGLAVKVTNNFFLIGLSSVEADRARNIQLLKERAWFDIPLVYEDGRRAIIAIEKGTPGERAFTKAFEAWGQ
jgi:hypothetical protein